MEVNGYPVWGKQMLGGCEVAICGTQPPARRRMLSPLCPATAKPIGEACEDGETKPDAAKATRSIESRGGISKARQVMPGGVSSPVRAFKAVGGRRSFCARGRGASSPDIDGNEYVDYIGSYGPMIVGHANDRVVAAFSKTIGRGTSFGSRPNLKPNWPTRSRLGPAGDGNGPLRQQRHRSGDERDSLGPRRNRRDLIVKCIGCYHGHADGCSSRPAAAP